MTRQERQQEAQDREVTLRAQRTALEADLTHVIELIDAETSKWAERRAGVQTLGEQVNQDADHDDARMAWYLAAYEDAQHAIVVTHGLMERYNEVARALTSCQQELLQLPRQHRRS